MPESTTNNKKYVSLNLDYRWVCIALLAVIIAMFIIWKPWDSTKSDRTIEVTGQTTLQAKPDSFVFYPMYDFKNSDREAALKQLTAKSDEVTKKLKELGVADSKIKTNSDGWGTPILYGDSKETTTYSLRFTITVDNQDLAQKVQDYLVSTTPSGSVSPQATFSDKKRRELEDKARDEAAKDARAKAEQSAKNLGFKLGAVKKIGDVSNFGGTYYGRDMAASMPEVATSLVVQPGENELSYSVTVTYFIK